MLRRPGFAALTLLSILAPLSFAATPDQVVPVTGGQVRGTALEQGGAVFRGIPYARPPLGPLRWREPAPVEPWTDIRDAKSFGPPCAQNPIFNANVAPLSKEDCLYLNVWTPGVPSSASAQPLKPVMVWIHGGGNMAGSSSGNSGEKLMRRDVLLVSMNYRMGIFGLFSHPELTAESPHHASGNQGFLDQIAALHWVHDNIAKFGGDPANVTIFGESAGSLNVSVLMTSPLSRGLFRRAIGQSGAVVLVGEPLPLAEAERRGTAIGPSPPPLSSKSIPLAFQPLPPISAL